MEIAVKAIVDYKGEKIMKEIRDEMDQTYEVGYAKTTETNEI
ncbi:PCYCGC motif-containing (lipo)protein [Lederbergia lenta]|nr:PCYCGC motif-containing (lipo)protein [Lederbergia lenta]MEC2325925.1 PCYCGC motif-containing (lipo)protein [Lederbergia lenta]